MEKLNGLPESWAVKNDGSEGFRVVVDYLNNTYDGMPLNGRQEGHYYGVCNGKLLLGTKDKVIVSSNPDNYDRILSIEEFKEMTAPKVVKTEIFYKRREKSGEREIRMSLETAREMYKSCHGNIKTWLLENFSKEELEGKKGFSWEESFDKYGWTVGLDSVIRAVAVSGDAGRSLFKEESQARSALAFAQLSHIVAKYNEGKKSSSNAYTVNVFPIKYGDSHLGLTEVKFGDRLPHLVFLTKEDAEMSMVFNRALWEQYWMV